MDNSNKKEFAQTLSAVGEMYDKKISTNLMKMYFDSLIDYSIGDVKSGLSKHSLDPKHGTFFPKPADIVRNIAGQQQTPTDRALIAWMEIEKRISSVGSYGTLKIEDKQAMMAVKAIGSWQQLCATDRDKLAFKRQEFIANYNALENTPVEMLPESLLGIADRENHKAIENNNVTSLLKRLEERKQ